tara:strand:+ start:4134 stop:6365 length:2232 start_codon:yes stop_codon:yes gene_type:complete
MRQLPILAPVLLLLWLIAAEASAEPAAEPAAEPFAEPRNGNDIKLIIDVSGSMKKNDPDNLRRPAVNLLMNLLPEDASAAVWLFGDKIEPLVPFGSVSADFKSNAIARSKLIHSQGLLTDIGGALEAAMLQEHQGGKAILLSDGMVDLGPDPVMNMAEQARIQHRLIPRLRASNAEIHTVALSENADRETLEAVSLATGGLFEVAKSADDLTRIFLRLFDDAVIQDRLPMEEGRFLVDSSVEEFTLLAFSGPGSAAIQIKSPDDLYYLAGDHPAEVKWYQDAGFDLITISRPLEGEWRLFSDDDPQNRVTVLSDLKLDVTNLANVLHEASFPILEARFLQGTDVITDATFLDLMDLQLIVLTPSGKRIARPLTDPVEGVFSSDLGVFAEPGRYSVNVNVDGKSFRREVVQEIEYGSPARVVFSAPERLVTVRPVAIGLLGEDLRMIVRLEDQQNKKRLLPMHSDGELWQALLKDVPDGSYRLTVHVKGHAKTGQPLDFTLEAQTIELSAVTPTGVEDSTSSEAWDLKQWGIAALVGAVNLSLVLLIIWFLRRRKQDSKHSEEDAEVAELLKLAPNPEATEGGAADDESDLLATLAEAEALREKEKQNKAAKPEPEVGAEVGAETEAVAAEAVPPVEPEPDIEEESAPEPDIEERPDDLDAPIPEASATQTDGLTDIVDAWGDDEDPIEATVAETEGLAEADDLDFDEDELEPSAALESEVDENAETQVLDESPAPTKDASSSG